MFRSAKAKLESQFSDSPLHSIQFGFTNLRASSDPVQHAVSSWYIALQKMRSVRSKSVEGQAQLRAMGIMGWKSTGALANRRHCQVASFAFAFLASVTEITFDTVLHRVSRSSRTVRTREVRLGLTVCDLTHSFFG